MPIDTFTGKPLKYRRTEQGFVLHSVGPDEKDDRGGVDESGQRELEHYSDDLHVVWPPLK